MGFSISGGAAIVFAGMFIAFGMFYSATADTQERINDARTSQADGLVEEKNAEVEVVSAAYDTTVDPNELTVEVNNTGATTLSVSDTDLLVNGQYQETEVSRTVDGPNTTPTTATDVWAPGERLTVVVEWPGATPRRPASKS
ncbi:flagellin [Haloarculaceae archaeon H-GB2-1]|nr:flagellin [Haloarculaceae archaeon H-GB11]MEA5407302.1 flagellin [Haloarculaceae archaeon H-GB2-1]